jgi:hypothetical protein
MSNLVGLALNPCGRGCVPDRNELMALGPQWVRFLLLHQTQNFDTGQNGELDWLLQHFEGLDIKVLALLNHETLNLLPDRHTPENEWGNFIERTAALAAKIAGFYGKRIGALEVLNEPDNWDGQDTFRIPPRVYGQVLAAAYPRVKAVNNLPVILAGLFDTSGGYLQEVLSVARGQYDGVGLHPYGLHVDGFPARVWGPPFRNNANMRDVLRQYQRMSGKPIWLTEIGVSENEQVTAEYLRRVFGLARALTPSIVATVFWFTWKFPLNPADPGDFGLVDLNGNQRAPWATFQAEARVPAAPAQAITQPQPPPPPPPPAQVPTPQPTLTAVQFAPTMLEVGQILQVSITVRNDSGDPLPTQNPPPGFVYDENESFVSRGFRDEEAAFRVGVEFEGRSGRVDHPYRWGLGAPLAPGQSVTVTGGIRLRQAQRKNFWAGLVQEQIAWHADQVGAQAVTITPTAELQQPAAPTPPSSPSPSSEGLGDITPPPQVPSQPSTSLAELLAQLAQMQQQAVQLAQDFARLNSILSAVKQVIQRMGF